MKRILLAVAALAMCTSLAAASPPAKGGAPTMAAVKAEMEKCAVCKHMAATMDQYWPMKMETARLNDGAAIMNSVAPAKAEIFHKAAEETHAAGEKCMAMTDDEAKSQLCAYCQEIRGLMKSGAKMSAGNTKNGTMMVLTSSDPALQTRIGELATKCEMMSAADQAQR